MSWEPIRTGQDCWGQFRTAQDPNDSPFKTAQDHLGPHISGSVQGGLESSLMVFSSPEWYREWFRALLSCPEQSWMFWNGQELCWMVLSGLEGILGCFKWSWGDLCHPERFQIVLSGLGGVIKWSWSVFRCPEGVSRGFAGSEESWMVLSIFRYL